MSAVRDLSRTLSARGARTRPRLLVGVAWVALHIVGCSAAQTSRAESAHAVHASSSAAELADQGLQRLSQGDMLRAEQYLQLAMQAGYPAERVIVPLLQACIASSRLRSALAHAEPFLRKHPDAWRVRYLAAAIHLALDNPARALVELDRVLAAQPDAVQAHYLRGTVLRDAFHDSAGARASFEAYLARAPHGEHAPELLAWLQDERTYALWPRTMPPVSLDPGGAP